jgi:poly(3-hydroxybutyrate) depolymerase
MGLAGFSWNAGGCCPYASNSTDADDVGFVRNLTSVLRARYGGGGSGSGGGSDGAGDGAGSIASSGAAGTAGAAGKGMVGTSVAGVANGAAGIRQDTLFLSGISNGGMMVNRLACELDGNASVTAVAAVSGPLVNATHPEDGDSFQCPHGNKPVPLLHIHGHKDPVVPFGGCNTTYTRYAIE